MDKLEKEIALFNHLDKKCKENTTPIPHKLMDMPLKCEIYGFMCWIISQAFSEMRDSNGKSNWECDAKETLGSKIDDKRVMTVNSIRKCIMICQGNDLLESCKEDDGKIKVKVNASFLFSDCEV